MTMGEKQRMCVLRLKKKFGCGLTATLASGLVFSSVLVSLFVHLCSM